MDKHIAEPLNELVGSQLYAVIFLATYLQLQFHGPQAGERHDMSIEIHPCIQAGGSWLAWGEPGYRDALCNQFGSTVRRAETDIEAEQIVIEFDSGALITISLSPADLAGMEAADYSHSLGSKRLNGALWTPTWKHDWKRLYSTRR